jgi:hypothetical protein
VKTSNLTYSFLFCVALVLTIFPLLFTIKFYCKLYQFHTKALSGSWNNRPSSLVNYQNTSVSHLVSIRHSRVLTNHKHKLLQEFRSLCEAVSRRVELSDTEYEYRPPYYHEKICRSYGEGNTAEVGNQVCTENRFQPWCMRFYIVTLPSSKVKRSTDWDRKTLLKIEYGNWWSILWP